MEHLSGMGQIYQEMSSKIQDLKEKSPESERILRTVLDIISPDTLNVSSKSKEHLALIKQKITYSSCSERLKEALLSVVEEHMPQRAKRKEREEGSYEGKAEKDRPRKRARASAAVPMDIEEDQVEKIKNSVYVLQGGKGILHYDEGKQSFVITLKTGPTRYVKLRGLHIKTATEEDFLHRSEDVCIFGKPPLALKIEKSRLREALEAFQKKGEEASDRQQVLEKELLERIFQEEISLEKVFSPAAKGDKKEKVTTEMAPSGNLRIVIKKPVGEGTYKKMYRDRVVWEGGHLYREPKVVARGKILDPGQVRETKKEIVMSRQFAARKIPGTLQMQQAPAGHVQKFRLEMPYVSGGTFRSLIKKAEEIHPSIRKQHLSYMKDIASALKGIHSAGYVYNDLKLENCLLDTEDLRAILADYGLAIRGWKKGLPGTFPAPECAIQEEGQSLPEMKGSVANDAWAFGLALYIAIRGQQAQEFVEDTLNWDHSRRDIEAAAKKIRKTLDQRDPADLLIGRLLSDDPKLRPSMEETESILAKILA